MSRYRTRRHVPGLGAQWQFLSDPGRIVQKDLDVQEYTDLENDPMIPHTLVLKSGLVIHSIYNGYWFWARPSVVDLWHDLRTVSREIRLDFDLATAGLREAWDGGVTCRPSTAPAAENTLSVLRDLRSLGVRLLLDDFGAGRSSLRHLRRLELDELKVDRALVLEMSHSARDSAIVAATVDLGLRVMGERRGDGGGLDRP